MKIIAVSFFTAIGLLVGCQTREEPVNEHYIPPTGEISGNQVSPNELMQVKPSDDPETEASDLSDADKPNRISVSHKCKDSQSGKEFEERDVGYQECMTRLMSDAQKRKTGN